MREPKDKKKTSIRKRFDRAMVDSTDLLSDLINDIEFQIGSDDFLVYEVGRLIQDGEPSLDDPEFRLLIEQGIRLHVNPDIHLRARLAERLRRAYPEMSSPARRVALDVIGAIEDADFSLDKIGAVVRNYTNQLFEKLEKMPDVTDTEATAKAAIHQWREGAFGRLALCKRLRELGTGSVAAVADMLFESLEDATAIETALELLSILESPVAARVLAYLVSEPILEEDQEDRARSILKEFWPLPRSYMLYKLRQHSHEDIPFRWLELLIETDDTRAVDRVLEEVVAHGRARSHREDLLTALGLVDRSNDPGVVGKVLRLMTEESLPQAILDLMEEWVEDSRLAEPIERELERLSDGKVILVGRMDDFDSFAVRQPEKAFDETREDWNAAYHESLGWQQRRLFPRGPVEVEFEMALEEAMMQKLSLNPQSDESTLRDQIESFREEWLVTPRENVIPLVAIYLERRPDNPWLKEIYWSEINGWYVRAAQLFDEGSHLKARQYLDIVLQVEPEYPLARALDAILRGSV